MSSENAVSSIPSRVAVLGAGLAGLRGADVLSRSGVEVIVIEKGKAPGGLASTVSEGGFHYDLGPHRFHTEKQAILEFVKDLLPDGLMQLNRLSRIRLLDRYFMYPLSFGDVLSKMPLRRAAAMGSSYLLQRLGEPFRKHGARDFRSWVTRRFGKKLYELYFGPYTEKLWGSPADQLSADWASQRITVPKLTDLVKATVFPSSNSPRSLVSSFHYPRGGIGGIARAMEESIRSRGGRFIYSTVPGRIEKCDSGGFRILIDGDGIEVDAILSSIPVTDYVELLADALPEKIVATSSRLSFRAIVFTVLKLGGELKAEDHWIYVPEEKYRFNRISFPGNFDPASDSGGAQLVFEYTCQRDDGVWTGGSDLAKEAEEGGILLGLFDEGDVVASTSFRYQHAYPIYSLNYRRYVTPVLDELDRLPGSVTCGRQGLFRYNNMDHSLEMGEYAALELLGSGRLRERFRWTRDTWADG